MAKGKSKGRNNSGGGGGAAQPIEFTGKESKQELIEKLTGSGAYDAGGSWEDTKVSNKLYEYGKMKKPELQQAVKRVNVDLENGGRGNANKFNREDRSSVTRNKVDAEIQQTPLFKRTTEKFKAEYNGGYSSVKKVTDEIQNLVNTKYYGSISKSERASYKKDVLAIIAKYD